MARKLLRANAGDEIVVSIPPSTSTRNVRIIVGANVSGYLVFDCDPDISENLSSPSDERIGQRIADAIKEVADAFTEVGDQPIVEYAPLPDYIWRALGMTPKPEGE